MLDYNVVKLFAKILYKNKLVLSMLPDLKKLIFKQIGWINCQNIYKMVIKFNINILLDLNNNIIKMKNYFYS